MADAKPNRILLGSIAGAHGIRGEVLIKTFTEAPENIGAYGPLADESGTRTFKVSVLRVTPKGVVARLQGITDRNDAEALKGASLYIERERLPAVAEDEFYHADLVGLAAVDPDGKPVGEVVAVHNFGAGDLLEIRPAGSGKTDLVPFTDATVPEVNITARRLTLVLPPTQDEPEPGHK